MQSLYFRLFSILFISCLGILVYSNTFHCTFHFDDKFFILDNSAIRNIQNLQGIWNYLPCRFIFYLSLALNYHFNQFNVFGFHIVNLLIHLVSAFLVWWLTLLTLSTPVMKAGTKVLPKSELPIVGHAPILALFAGLIFVSHPIQTQGVTYIMQRAASMATMFYLASLCFYIKARLLVLGDREGRPYYILSLISAILAMYTKEISITLPLMILLYEFSFFKINKSLNWKAVLPFLLTLFIIPTTMLFTHNESINSHEIQKAIEGTPDISSMQYFLTEFRVMVTYIRLLFLPLNQNVDYDYPISNSLFEFPTLISFLFLIGILWGAKHLFVKYRLLAFSIFWFFLTLMPESSLFSISDVIYEHRLYLPLVGYSMFLVTGTYYLLRNNVTTLIIALSIVVACNAVLTYQRNKIWTDDITLWSDVVKKSPHKARPYNNLGTAYEDQGNNAQAMVDYNKAIELKSNYADAYYNRANIYDKQGNQTQAMSDLNTVLEINPDYAKAYNERGHLYYGQNMLSQALSDSNRAIEIKPDFTEAYKNRSLIYVKEAAFAQAVDDCNKAIVLNPNYDEAYFNRGNAYSDEGNFDQAILDYTKAVEINPDYAESYSNRGVAYAQENNFSQAIQDFTQAIKIKPNYAESYSNRGFTYAKEGDSNQAISDYDQAIAISPNDGGAYYNRAISYYHLKKYDKSWNDVRKAEEFGVAVNPALIGVLKASVKGI